MINTLQLKAYGKVNLSLDVLRRREDGYHEVKMIMQTVQIYDRIRLNKKDTSGIEIQTNLPYLPVDAQNIAYKAAKLLMDEFDLPGGISIRIEKHIPVAAGMAGGSTNAAAVLYGMNRMYELGLSKKELMERGLRLGADVPYCIMRGTVLAEGIGEILTPVEKLPECYILVGKPPISVSTKHVYQQLKLDKVEKHPDVDGMIKALKQHSLEGVISTMGNILETVTIPEHPEIEQIKQLMMEHGALNALMSGSGPTVFGIFTDMETGLKAKEALKKSALARQIYLVKPFHTHHSGTI